MVAKTHANFGISFGLATLYLMSVIGALAFNPVLSIIYLYFVYKGSRIPDIDHPGSTIGRQHRVLSWVVSKLFGHRKFTHSIFFILILSACHFAIIYTVFMVVGYGVEEHFGFNYFNYFKTNPVVMTLFLSFGLAVGMFSHVVGDSLTKQGVRLLDPVSKKKFKLPFTFRTGSRVEKRLSVLFVIFNLMMSGVIIYNYWLTTSAHNLLASVLMK